MLLFAVTAQPAAAEIIFLSTQARPIKEAQKMREVILKDFGQEVNFTTFVTLGTLGADQQMYIPWMQASYIMAASRKALEHLPEGADVNALTYE